MAGFPCGFLCARAVALLTLAGPSVVDAADWLEGNIYLSRALTDEERSYNVTLGMNDQNDCSAITARSSLVLYVHPDTVADVCQGWNHYPNSYPDNSDPHENSARSVQCLDGGRISYTQWINVDCERTGPMADGVEKTEHPTCHQGRPPTVYTQMMDFSGCERLGFTPGEGSPGPNPSPDPSPNPSPEAPADSPTSPTSPMAASPTTPFPSLASSAGASGAFSPSAIGAGILAAVSGLFVSISLP